MRFLRWRRSADATNVSKSANINTTGSSHNCPTAGSARWCVLRRRCKSNFVHSSRECLVEQHGRIKRGHSRHSWQGVDKNTRTRSLCHCVCTHSKTRRRRWRRCPRQCRSCSWQENGNCTGWPRWKARWQGRACWRRPHGNAVHTCSANDRHDQTQFYVRSMRARLVCRMRRGARKEAVKFQCIRESVNFPSSRMMSKTSIVRHRAIGDCQ